MRGVLALPLLTFLAGLSACADDEPTFCDRWKASKAWAAIPYGYRAHAFTGAIEIKGDSARTFRDDRVSEVLELRESAQYLLITASSVGATSNAAALRLRVPSQAGTFRLESYDTELYYCEGEGMSLEVSTGNGSVRGCKLGSTSGTAIGRLRRVPLNGTLVTRPKPPLEQQKYGTAYDFAIDGRSEDDEATVNLTLLAFDSHEVGGVKGACSE